MTAAGCECICSLSPGCSTESSTRTWAFSSLTETILAFTTAGSCAGAGLEPATIISPPAATPASSTWSFLIAVSFQLPERRTPEAAARLHRGAYSGRVLATSAGDRGPGIGSLPLAADRAQRRQGTVLPLHALHPALHPPQRIVGLVDAGNRLAETGQVVELAGLDGLADALFGHPGDRRARQERLHARSIPPAAPGGPRRTRRLGPAGLGCHHGLPDCAG